MSDLISKGRHPAVCSGSIQLSTVGEGDNEKEQVVVQFTLNDENDPFNGWSITWFGFLTEKTWERTIEALRIMGWTGDDMSELPALAASGSLGNQVEIVIDHEEYKGEWQAKVRWVNRPGGGAVKVKNPLEGAALAKFAARMKGKIRTVPPVGGSRPSNGAAPAPHPNALTPRSDDDIPFLSCSLADEPSPIAKLIRGGV